MPPQRKKKSVQDSTIPKRNLLLTIGDLKAVSPLTETQRKFFNLYKKNVPGLFLHGVAGTGKTYIALWSALDDILSERNEYDRVIIVRSAVPSREIGHLPGTEKEKTEVYAHPYMDMCSDLFPKYGQLAYNKLKEQNKLVFMSSSFVRGLTFDNAIVIVDEAQNMSLQELNSIITRVGQDTRIIFCGDYRQTDLSRKHDMSGIKKFIEIISRMPSFNLLEFGVDDIVRSEFVRQFLIATMEAEDHENKSTIFHKNV
jgi:phosphate starvation-inducible PhoH-like protein